MEISTIGTTSAATTEQTGGSMAELPTADFLNLLITELTHQDPFEPVKNSDLLNQISSIRDLEMNTRMDETLSSLAKSNAGLNETMSSLIAQSNMNSAGAMIGQVVIGYDADGERLAGKVIGVNVQGGEVKLKLDTGREISADMVNQVLSAEGITGQVVVAVVTRDDGTTVPVVGTVSELQVVNDEALLLLESDQRVALADVRHMIPGGRLIGESVTGVTLGGDTVAGTVTGVALTEGLVMLELDTGRQIVMASMRFTDVDAG